MCVLIHWGTRGVMKIWRVWGFMYWVRDVSMSKYTQWSVQIWYHTHTHTHTHTYGRADTQLISKRREVIRSVHQLVVSPTTADHWSAAWLSYRSVCESLSLIHSLHQDIITPCTHWPRLTPAQGSILYSLGVADCVTSRVDLLTLLCVCRWAGSALMYVPHDVLTTVLFRYVHVADYVIGGRGGGGLEEVEIAQSAIQRSCT